MGWVTDQPFSIPISHNPFFSRWSNRLFQHRILCRNNCLTISLQYRVYNGNTRGFLRWHNLISYLVCAVYVLCIFSFWSLFMRLLMTYVSVCTGTSKDLAKVMKMCSLFASHLIWTCLCNVHLGDLIWSDRTSRRPMNTSVLECCLEAPMSQL